MPTPQSLQQFGASVKAKHPEYADLDDASVGQKVLAKFPQYSDMVDPSTIPGSKTYAPPMAAHPAVDMQAPSIPQYLQGDFDSNTRTGPQDTLPQRVLKRATAAAGSPLVHPVRTAQGVGGMLKAGADSVALAGSGGMDPDAASAVANSPAGATVGDYAQTYREGGIPAVLANATGDLAGGALTGEALKGGVPLALDAGADALNATGRAAKGAGALVSRVTAGMAPAEDSLGADAGRALSQNRIVGGSPRSLASKVSARIGPAAEARDAILARSSAPPTDISTAVTDPFDDISAIKTDPKTGAVRPNGMAKMNTMRRAISSVQDPETGAITSTPKDPNLTPAQMGSLQRNVYQLTDYADPEGDLANQYTKGVGAALKDRINQAAPEASTMTDSLHDLLGAGEQLKARIGGPPSVADFSPGKLAGSLFTRAKTFGGTAAGAGLDVAGSGMQRAAGFMRDLTSGGSPVAPASPAPLFNKGPRPGLPADVPANAEFQEGPLPPAGTQDFQRSPTAHTPPTPPVRQGLPQSAGPDGATQGMPVGNLHPGAPDPNSARMRVLPSTSRPTSQQVISDQPGYVPPVGTRRIIAGPDGTLSPEPIPLGAGGQPAGLLESRTGPRAPSARASLLSRLKGDMEVGSAQQRAADGASVNASRAKLAAVPVGSAPDAPAPATASPQPPSRLPDPGDVDGWEALVDKDMARYNPRTHQYDYTGPTRSLKQRTAR